MHFCCSAKMARFAPHPEGAKRDGSGALEAPIPGAEPAQRCEAGILVDAGLPGDPEQFSFCQVRFTKGNVARSTISLTAR